MHEQTTMFGKLRYPCAPGARLPRFFGRLAILAALLITACTAPDASTPAAAEATVQEAASPPPQPSATATAAPTEPPPTATAPPAPTVEAATDAPPTPTSTPVLAPTIAGADGLDMNLVPGGEYYMGSNVQFAQFAARWCQDSGSGDDCVYEDFENEVPEHAVVLDAFYMDVTEVTNAHYRVCVQAGDCAPPMNGEYYNSSQYDDHPVVHVTWHDAQDYCQAMGERLPTEAEWEMAARGNGWLMFPWGDEWDATLTNTQEQGGNQLRPVGQYPGGASPFGILDLSGNVWEWVADWYDAAYYQTAPLENPLGPPAGSEKVLRGGGFSSYGYYARAMNRGFADPATSSVYRGFRCVISAADAGS